jgi:hypothetical protein
MTPLSAAIIEDLKNGREEGEYRIGKDEFEEVKDLLEQKRFK